MKKLVVLGAGALAVAAAALLSPGVADSEPGQRQHVRSTSSVSRTARRLPILKSQGVKAFFGGSVGSDLPQAAVHRLPAEDHLAAAGCT